MTITPETNPDHSLPPSPPRRKETPIRCEEPYKLGGIIIDPFTPQITKEFPLAGRKSLFRHTLTEKEKEIILRLSFSIRLAGDVAPLGYPIRLSQDELCFLPEHVFTRKDLPIATAIQDMEWDEILALLAPVTPQEPNERQAFLEDYRRIYDKLQEYNIDFDGYSPLYKILKGLKVSEALIVHSILKNGLKKAQEENLPPLSATDAEILHHAEKRERIIEKLKRYGIDIPE